MRRRDLPAAIEWLCPECEAVGRISGWEDTDADLRGLELGPGPGATTVAVSVDAHRELRDIARDDAAWLPLAYGAVVVGDSPALTVTREQAVRFRTLATTAALVVASDRRRRRLVDIADALAIASAQRTAADPFVALDAALGAALGEFVMSLDDVAPPQFVPARARPRPKSTRGKAARTAPTFQLKVTLRDVRPPVWRRLIVPADISLDALHTVLQAAMGWYDCHLHLFRAGDREFAPPGDWEPVGEDSTGVVLRDLAPGKGSRLIYEYDFGDCWVHDILVEKVIDQQCAQVRCLTGRRRCPPEDCGGPWGYEELRAALADPRHERHDEMRAWAPEGFDAEEFDVVQVDDAVRRVRV